MSHRRSRLVLSPTGCQNRDLTGTGWTVDGTSGSVVFSRKNDCPHIVGLHHWGYLDYTDDAENQAVHVSEIKKLLQRIEDSDEAEEAAAARKILSPIKIESCNSQ